MSNAPIKIEESLIQRKLEILNPKTTKYKLKPS